MTVWLVANECVDPKAGYYISNGILTTYCPPTFDSRTNAILERVTTLPDVPANLSESGMVSERTERFDRFGNLITCRTQLSDKARTRGSPRCGVPADRRCRSVAGQCCAVGLFPHGWFLHLVTDFTVDPLDITAQMLCQTRLDLRSQPFKRADFSRNRIG